MKIVEKLFIKNRIPLYILPVNKYLRAELIYTLIHYQLTHNNGDFAIA